MNFKDSSLDKSQIEYMWEHDFIDDRLWSIYRESCRKDFNSPRCKYFQYELQLDEQQVNPYSTSFYIADVYEVCKTPKTSETFRMLEAVRKFRNLGKNKNQPLQFQQHKVTESDLGEIDECPNDVGAQNYWNLNKYHYHVDHTGKTWAPCINIRYTITEDGSMKEYAQIFLNKAIKVWLFNGDWDDVVPYRDTENNLEILKIPKTGEWDPWYVGEHHAGFYQVY